jgi:shikimate kinase
MQRATRPIFVAVRYPAIQRKIAALPSSRQAEAACGRAVAQDFAAQFLPESLESANSFPATPSRYIGRIAMTSAGPHHDSEDKADISLDRPVVLVGMMGVGKSSVGRMLANRLGLHFIDTDEEIERAADLSIAEIFERFGEDYFRDGERRVIARLIGEGPAVIATGGGAFINDATRALIKEKCHSVWINADLDILVARVSRRSHRPLLIGKDPRAVLTELSEKRGPIYAQADFHVRSDAAPHRRTVDQILKALETCKK